MLVSAEPPLALVAFTSSTDVPTVAVSLTEAVAELEKVGGGAVTLTVTFWLEDVVPSVACTNRV